MESRVEFDRSDSLRAITYNDITATLDVEFRKGGVYRYYMVPKGVLEELVHAPSPGHAYVTIVRGRYRERRVEPNERYN